jgi:hypothetical protein
MLLDHRALGDDDLAVLGHEVLGRGAAENARGQRGHDLAGIDDGAHLDAVVGAAIILANDRILRHVDETAGQVA